MSETLNYIAEVVVMYCHRSFEIPMLYIRSLLAGALSLVEILLELGNLKFISDIRRIKEANLAIIEANARKKIAEADDREVCIAITQSKADAIRMDAESRRIATVAEAWTKLFSALSQVPSRED